MKNFKKLESLQCELTKLGVRHEQLMVKLISEDMKAEPGRMTYELNGKSLAYKDAAEMLGKVIDSMKGIV